MVRNASCLSEVNQKEKNFYFVGFFLMWKNVTKFK